MDNSMRCSITLAALLLGGCATAPKIDHTALVTKTASARYQIELRGDFTYWGGPCVPLPIPSRDTETYHLYVGTLQGYVPADAVELVVLPPGTQPQPGWTMKRIRGSLTFTNQTLVVDLLEPRYNGRSETPDHYAPFKLNGQFRFTFPPE